MYKRNKLNFTLVAPTSIAENGFAKGLYLNKKDTTEPLKLTFPKIQLGTKPEYLTVQKPSWFRFECHGLPQTISEMYMSVEKSLRKDYPELLWKSDEDPLIVNWPKIADGLVHLEVRINGQDRFATIEEVLDLFSKDGVLVTKEVTLLFKPWLKQENNVVRAGICAQLVNLNLNVSQEDSGME